MYIPPLFREERKEVLHALIGRHSLATLVTMSDHELVANHIPLVLHPDQGVHGVLRGHMARGNTQWRGLRPEAHSLAIFQGPSAYISPSWYATKQETGKVVPTYNYAVVHAHGPLQVVEDLDQLEEHVRTLTDVHESRSGTKWSVDDAPRDFLREQLKHIVGIAMTIVKLEGKWKVSQNRAAADRAGAASGLRSRGSEGDIAVAEWIEQNSPSS